MTFNHIIRFNPPPIRTLTGVWGRHPALEQCRDPDLPPPVPPMTRLDSTRLDSTRLDAAARRAAILFWSGGNARLTEQAVTAAKDAIVVHGAPPHAAEHVYFQ